MMVKSGNRYIALAAALMAMLAFCGCSTADTANANTDNGNVVSGSAGSGNAASAGQQGSGALEQLTVSADGESIELPESKVDIKFTDRDKSGEYAESSAVRITLDNNQASVSGSGASVSGSTVTIKDEGVYILSGTLNNGQIIVEASDSDKVQLVLNNADITCNTSAAIYVKSADKVFITLAEGTSNKLADGGAYVNIDDNNIDGVIFSKCDLTLNGSGAVSIDANYKHGIVSKDTLCITGGTYAIDAVSVCLSGKDGIKISDGTFTLTTDNDGIKSGNEDDSSEGNIYIAGGVFSIKAGDDAVHADGSTVIAGGTLTIAAVDDAVHSDCDTVVNGGTITITESYEGLEGLRVTINGGTITLTSSDDGINAAGGNDSSSMMGPGRGNNPMAADADAYISITGGEINVNAGGDGLDSNGSLYISGGTVYVSGPVNSANGALDYGGEARITGGILIAAGAAGMAQGMGSASTQCSMLVNLSGTMAAGTAISLNDSEGRELIKWTSPKQYSSVVVSLPALTEGSQYTLITGDTQTQITLDSVSTTSGGGGFGGFGGFDRQKGNKEEFNPGAGQDGNADDFGGKFDRGQRQGIDMSAPDMPGVKGGEEPGI